mgnify:FL=1|jgi:DNA-binding transcriptional regulator GbsR (MarR family)
MKDELTVEKKQVIEDFGNGYTAFGQPRVRGRIVGLLLSSRDALSLDDITRLLQVSKGPVSIETRLLEEFGMIHSVHKPSDRKTYYEITKHPFSRSARRNLWLIRRNQQIAASILETSDSLEPEVKLRFDRMERFHSQLHDMFTKFMEDWEADKL